MAAARVPRTVSVADLRAECEALVPTVRHDAGVSDEQIAAWRPGGPENRDSPGRPASDARCWLRFYRWLHRALAVAHARQPTPGGEGALAEAEGAAMLALAEVPEVVELGTPLEWEGETIERVAVHPKGLRAAITMHALDLRISAFAYHRDAHRESADPDGQAVVALALEGIAEATALLVWAACHPGPWLPWDPVSEPDPTPPGWVAGLSVLDTYRIASAMQKVMAQRLLLLEPLMAPDPQDGTPRRRLSWSAFAAEAAKELGISDRDLHYARSLPQIVASRRLVASAEREAYQAAEATAKRRRGTTT